MAYLLAFAPIITVTLLLIIAERLRGAPPTDWQRNLEAWGAQFAAALLVLPLLHGWAGPSLLQGARLPFWAGFAIFLLVKDLGEYFFHRAQHRIPFLWAMHALHHSDPEMAALTAQRHFWGDQLLKQLTIWPVAVMVIAPTPAMLGAYGLVSLWNFLTHADLSLDFGRWSWVINSPAYHRRHHSRLPEHYDSNFAALLPIFDVICGSYHQPQGFPPTGLARAPQSLGEVLIWPLIWNRPASTPEAAAPTA